MIQSRRRTSILGVIALLAGIAAILMGKLDVQGLPMVNMGPVHLKLVQAIAAGALLVGVIAFLAAASSPRTNAMTPMLATTVCIVAVALAFYPHLFHRTPTLIIKPAPANPPPVTSPPVQASAPGNNQKPHIKTIFDPDYPSSKVPATDSKPPAKWSPPPLPAEVTPPPVHRDVIAEIREARAKQQAARAAVIHSLESTRIYQAARADADAAEADLKQARATYPPASPELVAASQTALQARSRLEHIIAAALANDPSAQAADRELKAASSDPPQ
jgi:hypothetical protein